MDGVETSDMYMGTIMVNIPMGNPAMARPRAHISIASLSVPNDSETLTSKEHWNRPGPSLQS